MTSVAQRMTPANAKPKEAVALSRRGRRGVKTGAELFGAVLLVCDRSPTHAENARSAVAALWLASPPPAVACASASWAAANKHAQVAFNPDAGAATCTFFKQVYCRYNVVSKTVDLHWDIHLLCPPGVAAQGHPAVFEK